MRHLRTVLREGADKFAGSPALLAEGRQPLSHAGLASFVETTVGRLRLAGVGPTDRVAVVLPGDAVMATAFLGVASAAVCVPLNPTLRADEFRRMMSEAGVRHVLLPAGEAGAARRVAGELGLDVLSVVPQGPVAGGFDLVASEPGGAAEPSPTPDEADVALVLYTSGSTSQPKRVPLSHRNLVAAARANARVLRLAPEDRCLGTMPLFHIGGLVSAWLASVVSGGSFVATGPFDAERFFDRVGQFDPTWYAAGPTVHDAVLARADRYATCAPGHRFRFVRSASAPLPAATRAGLARVFHAPVAELYGMTEAGRIAGTPPEAGAARDGAVGRPVDCDVAIVDEAGRRLPVGATGEIVVRGDVVMAGYEDDAEANRRAFLPGGWFRTGDVGRLDADGYLSIAGRLKDIVNRGGQKVAPAEVDHVLGEHPAVSQAAVFPVPHPTLGEDLAAAVVRAPGRHDDEAALRAYLFERLSAFKVPGRIVFVEAIPKGATGKVQRHLLAERLAGELQSSFVPLATEAERVIESLWRDALGCGPLGARDNFFARGGDSLRGVRIVARLNELHDLNLPANLLFRHPVLDEFARAVEAARAERERQQQALLADIEQLSDEDIQRLLSDDPSSAVAERR